MSVSVNFDTIHGMLALNDEKSDRLSEVKVQKSLSF